MGDSDRAQLWTELIDVANKHRTFADAEWAMPPERLQLLDTAATQLEPTKPSLKYRRLFGQREGIDLFESRDDFAFATRILDAQTP